MACEVCKHCNTTVHRDEVIVQEGYSYHTRCHKCYVCSETNLQNADTFQGVIFCYGCSNRIFQGCSTARRTRMRRSKRPAYAAYKEREKRRQKKGYNMYANRVLELAKLTAMDSRSFSGQSKECKASAAPSTVATALTSYTYRMKPYKLEKDSVEMGTTTTVTKELLKHIQSPTDLENKTVTPVKPRKKRKSQREKNYKKNHCSDLRVAELGASTEIAHVALRKRSEIPVIIKSKTSLKRTATQNLSNLTQESDISGEGDSRGLQYSECSSDLVDSNHGVIRTIASMIKLPYKSFKRNILDRSALISDIMNSRESECILHKFRTLFQHEITEHRQRGLKRLFSTINRRKEQYKLGWLDVMSQIPEDDRIPNKIKKREKRCRHFKQCHSYRCMRSQVMRLAGPTRSELAVFRKKVKNAFYFNLCKGLRNFNDQYVDILTSVAYEQSRKAPGPVRICSDTLTQ